MWERIVQLGDWFRDFSDRRRLVRQFNEAANAAFIGGLAPTLLKSSVSNGDSSYKHSFSRLMAGGFRIKALSGRALDRREMEAIGHVVLDNQELVRKLVSLGWDTLEVHDNGGYHGLKWPLYKYSGIGGILGNDNY